jgi:FkbM family methyltransferase|tara:strand:- start:1560 stop:2315 length:756 start_codon:yes stop_codon:yes gene_type:complete
MRFKFHKEIEFFLKKFFFPEPVLLKRRLERSIKNKDENEIDLLKRFIKPGTDSIDVGVYRGVYSYEMSKYSKKVHSFEPNPLIFKYINKNLKKISSNIDLYNFALSNENKVSNLRIPIRNKKIDKENYEEHYLMGRATVHELNNFQDYEKFEITLKKIDDFNFDNEISFMKIDVEGHEMEVIEGGKLFIKKNKPVLLVEIEERHSKKNIHHSIDYINGLGYNSYFYDENNLKKTSELKNMKLFTNFIFLPY